MPYEEKMDNWVTGTFLKPQVKITPAVMRNYFNDNLGLLAEFLYMDEQRIKWRPEHVAMFMWARSLVGNGHPTLEIPDINTIIELLATEYLTDVVSTLKW